MIIINRKKLNFVLGICLISLFVFTFHKASMNKTVETVNLPVSNKVIVLDAGHRNTR